MHPNSVEWPVERLESGEEPWRIHLDLDDSYQTVDGRPPFHNCDGVSRRDAEGALARFQSRSGDGIRFMERDSSQSWFYPWSRVLNLRIMPMREAV